ncbi:MAG TPA: hypothetical protein VM451_09325 [Candidatus Limnocylindria bacterium]|nr:hypothetical protein [Candidatus Limnocylindria bacterium]
MTCSPEEGAVVPGVRQQQEHAGLPAITLLQRDPTLERLRVTDMCLSFDPHPNAGSVDPSVPCPPVHDPGCRELDHRQLFAPGQLGVDPLPEPTQQRDLRSVPERRATKECFRREFEAHRLEHLRARTMDMFGDPPRRICATCAGASRSARPIAA